MNGVKEKSDALHKTRGHLIELKAALAYRWIRISLSSLSLSNLWNSQLQDIDVNCSVRLRKKGMVIASYKYRRSLSSRNYFFKLHFSSGRTISRERPNSSCSPTECHLPECESPAKAAADFSYVPHMGADQPTHFSGILFIRAAFDTQPC